MEEKKEVFIIGHIDHGLTDELIAVQELAINRAGLESVVLIKAEQDKEAYKMFVEHLCEEDPYAIDWKKPTRKRKPVNERHSKIIYKKLNQKTK